MKKLFLNIILIITSCLIITGCTNNKKIECATYENINNEIVNKATYNYYLDFDKTGNKLIKFTIISTLEFKSKEILEEQTKNVNFCEEYIEKKDAIKCNTTTENNTITLNIEYDYDKLTKEEKEKLSYENLELTFDAIKDFYESKKYEQNFCKFKSKQKIEPLLIQQNTIDQINSSQKSLAETSTNGILMTAQAYFMTYMLENNGNIPGELTFICDGNSCHADINSQTIKLDIKGIIPTSGQIQLNNDGTTSITSPLIINGYSCISNNNNISCIQE